MGAIPKWARGILKNHDLERVSLAVQHAESRSAGEFVVCVVRRSSGVSHASTVAALVIFSVLLMLSQLAALPGDYGNPALSWFAEALLAALAGHFAGQSAFVQRLFIPKHERQLLVHRRARLEFHQNHLEKTKGATGILIFVSLMERQAVVLADRSIASKLAPEAWQGVLKKILDGVKRGSLGGGLVEALELSADLVAPHFPRKGKKKNELSDRLLVKE